MVNTRLNKTSVFASLPFDQIDGVAGFFVHEDFEGVAVGGDMGDLTDSTGKILTTMGPHSWWGTEISGGAASNVTVPTSVADHLGIIQLETGATTPTTGDACAIQFGAAAAAVQEMYLPDDNGCYIATVLKVVDLTNDRVEFGFVGQTPTAVTGSALDLATLAFDPSNTANVGDVFFIAHLNDAGTDVEVVLDQAAIVASDWVLLEIALTSTGASYRVTTEDVSETVKIAGTITVAVRPAYMATAVTTAEVLVAIDLFHLRYLRRDALVGTGSDWLGA